MVDAIGKTGVHLIPTKVEIRFTGVTKRPFADPIIQIEQRCFVRNFGAGARRNQPTGRCRWRRRRLFTRILAHKAARPNGSDCRRHLVWIGCPRNLLNGRLLGCARLRRGRLRLCSRRSGRCFGARRCWLATCAAFAVAGLNWRRARLKPKAVCLTDNGIAADAAQLFGNLGCCHPFAPHRSQLFDAFIGPGHVLTISNY